MGTQYKIVKDNINNGVQVIIETWMMLQNAKELYNALSPIPADKKVPLREVIQGTALALKRSVIDSFPATYPELATNVMNGESSDQASNRIHEAIYTYRSLLTSLKNCRYIVKTTQERASFFSQAQQVVADSAAYIILQFGLWKDDGTVMMAVDKFCEKAGITPDVFYGTLLSEMEEANGEFFVYEQASKMHDTLSSAYPVLLQECEENGWKFDEELCNQLLSGDKSLEEVRQQLVANNPEYEEVDVDVPLKKLVGDMDLN